MLFTATVEYRARPWALCLLLGGLAQYQLRQFLRHYQETTLLRRADFDCANFFLGGAHFLPLDSLGSIADLPPGQPPVFPRTIDAISRVGVDLGVPKPAYYQRPDAPDDAVVTALLATIVGHGIHPVSFHFEIRHRQLDRTLSSPYYFTTAPAPLEFLLEPAAVWNARRFQPMPRGELVRWTPDPELTILPMPLTFLPSPHPLPTGSEPCPE